VNSPSADVSADSGLVRTSRTVIVSSRETEAWSSTVTTASRGPWFPTVILHSASRLLPGQRRIARGAADQLTLDPDPVIDAEREFDVLAWCPGIQADGADELGVVERRRAPGPQRVLGGVDNLGAHGTPPAPARAR
jgi:hypothetical protein